MSILNSNEVAVMIADSSAGTITGTSFVPLQFQSISTSLDVDVYDTTSASNHGNNTKSELGLQSTTFTIEKLLTRGGGGASAENIINRALDEHGDYTIRIAIMPLGHSGTIATYEVLLTSYSTNISKDSEVSESLTFTSTGATSDISITQTDLNTSSYTSVHGSECVVRSGIGNSGTTFTSVTLNKSTQRDVAKIPTIANRILLTVSTLTDNSSNILTNSATTIDFMGGVIRKTDNFASGNLIASGSYRSLSEVSNVESISINITRELLNSNTLISTGPTNNHVSVLGNRSVDISVTTFETTVNTNPSTAAIQYFQFQLGAATGNGRLINCRLIATGGSTDRVAGQLIMKTTNYALDSDNRALMSFSVQRCNATPQRYD